MERLTSPNINVDPGTDRFLHAAIGGKEIDWKTNAGVVEDTLTITLYAKLLRKKMNEGKITEESAIRAGAMAASELWLKEVNHA